MMYVAAAFDFRLGNRVRSSWPRMMTNIPIWIKENRNQICPWSIIMMYYHCRRYGYSVYRFPCLFNLLCTHKL